MKQLAIDTPYTFFENKNLKFVGKNLAYVNVCKTMFLMNYTLIIEVAENCFANVWVKKNNNNKGQVFCMFQKTSQSATESRMLIYF